MRKFTLLSVLAFISFHFSLFAVGTEQSLYSTNFQDWTEPASASTTATVKSLTSNYGEAFTVSLTSITALPANPAKTTGTLGAVRFEKVATAAFETSPLASVTKVNFIAYVSGSSRGYTIYKKNATDADWVQVQSAFIAQAGEAVSVAINDVDVAIKIVNNPSTQYFFLTDFEIFGLTTAVVPVFQSSTPAANAVIPTSGTIELSYSEAVTRGTGNITLGGNVVAESDITFNGSVVSIAYAALSTDTSYDLVVPTGAFINGASTPTASALTLSFKTPDTQAPTYAFQTDGDYVTVPASGTIALMFNEPVKAGAVPVTIGSVNITPGISASQNYLVYLNYSGLDFATDYVVNIPEGAITDLSGNSAPAKTIHITTEGNYKGAKLLTVSPNQTDFPTTITLGDVTKTYTGEDGLTSYDVTFGNIGTPADRGANGWGFKTDYVLLPKTKIGNVSFKIQCGGGSVPQKYFIQKLAVDGTTWANIDTIMIGTNDVITFTSAVAQSSDSTTIRLMKEGSSFWFYNVAIYDFLDNNAANDDGLNPSLVSSVPADNGIDVATSGVIKLTFSESVKSGSGTFTLNGKTLTPNMLGNVVSLPYSNLKYGTQYQLEISAGAVTDYLSNPCAQTTISITTKTKPAVTPSLYDFVVAQDGSGNGLTIQSAFDAVPAANTNVFRIFVKNGTYAEYPTLADGKTNVSLIGQSIDGVVITGSHYSGQVVNSVTIGTTTSQTLEIMADNFYCENITVANTAGVNTGQAVALKVYGDKCVFKNVRLLGYQDTHITSNVATDRQYYLNCDIHGTVDFIFNDGIAFFDNTRLYIEDRTAANVICAPATSTSNTYGYVFSDCTIDGASSQDGVYFLARPWKNAPRAVYLNTKMNILPANDAWTTMSALPALFVEYNSVNRTGASVVLAPRTDFTFTSGTTVNDSLSSTRLSSIDAATAATYTRENVLAGADSWDATTKIDAPAAVENLTYNAGTSKLTWTATDGAACYVVLIDGVVVDFTTATEYTSALSTVKYEVIAASEYGALSAAASTGTIGVSEVSAKQSFIVSTVVDSELLLANADEIATINIVALSGQNVLSAKVNGSSVSVTSLQAGCYLVKATTKTGETYIDKIIKK